MPRASGDRGWHLTNNVARITVIRWAPLFGNMAAEPFEWLHRTSVWRIGACCLENILVISQCLLPLRGHMVVEYSNGV